MESLFLLDFIATVLSGIQFYSYLKSGFEKWNIRIQPVEYETNT